MHTTTSAARHLDRPLLHHPPQPSNATSELRAALHALAAKRDVWTTPLTHGTAIAASAAHVNAEIPAASRLAHSVIDHRYYDVVHHTLHQQFQLNYLILRDANHDFRGIHPFFLQQQDILAGAPGKISRFAQRLRRAFPRFLTLKTLMVGNPAGPAALGLRRENTSPDDASWTARALTESLMAYGHHHKVSLLVLKDFPATDRHSLHALTNPHHGFARLPSMPMTSLHIAPYKSFDDYMQRGLSKVTRKGIRRKLRDAEAQPLDFSVTNDISDCLQEVYQLYLNVHARAKLTFEKLTPEFLLELGRRMPDRARFFLWRIKNADGSKGRLVAASITLVNTENNGTEKALYDLYLGMEYPLALDLHLYMVTMRDVIDWSLEHGVETYYSTPLSYDTKLHLKHTLVPQDLYVRHLSNFLNPAVKLGMRFAEPTRHDKILPQFPNAHQLKD